MRKSGERGHALSECVEYGLEFTFFLLFCRLLGLDPMTKNAIKFFLVSYLGVSPMRLVSNTTRVALAIILLGVCFLGELSAQTTTSERRGTMVLTEGRRYMVAFPQVWASPSEKPMPQPMQLFISSKTKGKVRVQTPALINGAARMDREYTLEANKVLRVPISTAYMNTESESRRGYGILVTSSKPISVTTYQAWMGNGEMARHLPVEGWGKNYYTMNFYQDRYGNGSGAGYKYRPAQIVVIADKDNTVVSYTPTVATEGGEETPSVRKGSTQTVTLERGETFLIKSKISELENKEWTSDPTGTWIRASKPVSVVSGHTKVAIMRYPDVLPPTGMWAAEAHFVRNNVHDAMLPLEMSGTRFVTTPCKYTSARVTGQASIEFGIDDDRGDVIRVVALEDNTIVKAMRQDGSGLLNKWSLKRGETRLETALEVATYWESDKPILMGQYGKSYAKILPPVVRSNGSKDVDDAQGHPTVESGMPMFQYIPSVDRWVEYGVFHAPEGTDNYFNIVFKTNDIAKIKVDGRSLTSAFGGSMRLIRGTEFAFIATPIGSGDHVIESVDGTVRWAAWNYGSLDGLQQGRAYGTPISIDMTIPCNDSLAVTEEIVCGNVVGRGNILPENTTCGSIFAVYPEELTNYELIVDEEFNSGDRKVDFRVNVLDKTKDGIAVIRVVSRSGKFVEKTYTYIADKISWTPVKIDFGTIAFNTPECKTLTIKNEKTDRPVMIRKIKVMANGQVFTVTPEGPFNLGAGESRDVTVCATIKTAPLVIDTVLVELPCFDQKTAELRVRGEEPVIYVADVDWGVVPASSPGIERPVDIQNGSRVPLELTGFDEALLDGTGNFFNPVTMDGQPLVSAFPLSIPANAKYTFKVTYSPKGEDKAHRVDVPFYSNAVRVDSIAVLKGEGVKINLTATANQWNERVIDNVQTTLGINEYTQRAHFFNYGAQPVTFNQPFIRGVDAGNFRVVNNGDVGTFPTQLVGGSATQGRYITIAFVPTELANRAAERNNYKAELVFPTTAAEQPEVVVNLMGTAWQPQVKGADLDFPGTLDVGSTAQVLSIPIVNEHYTDLSNPTSGTTAGTYDVVITNIRITDPNTKFELLNAPTPQNPWRIAPGEAPMELQVRFNPTSSGNFESPYEIVTNVGTNGQATYQPVYKITARVQGGEFTVTGSDAEQYVYNTRDMKIQIRHTENTTRRFNIMPPVGADGSRFQIVDQYIDVAPGAVGEVNVVFTPDFVTRIKAGQTWNAFDAATRTKASAQGLNWRNNGFTADVDIEDDQNKKVQTATLTGNGIYLETQDLVADNYKVAPGQSAAVAIELRATPEKLDVGDVTGIRVRVSYDNKLVKPRTNVADIITAGTLTEGWTVKEVKQVTTSMLEIDLYDPRPTPAALRNIDVPTGQTPPPLFKITFDAFLGSSKANYQAGEFVSPVTVYSYPVDFNNSGIRNEFVFIIDRPGRIAVTLPCAQTTRLVALGTTNYAINPMKPNPVTNSGIINYSIGISADTRIMLYNSMGEEVMTLMNDKLQAGTYEMTVDFSTLSAGTYYYRVISGPFTSELQTVSVVK